MKAMPFASRVRRASSQRGFTPIRDLLSGLVLFGAIGLAFWVSEFWTLVVLGLLAAILIVLMTAMGRGDARARSRLAAELERMAKEKGWILKLVTRAGNNAHEGPAVLAFASQPGQVVFLGESGCQTYALPEIAWLSIEQQPNGWQFDLGLGGAGTGDCRTGLREDDARRWIEVLAPHLGERLKRRSAAAQP